MGVPRRCWSKGQALLSLLNYGSRISPSPGLRDSLSTHAMAGETEWDGKQRQLEGQRGGGSCGGEYQIRWRRRQLSILIEVTGLSFRKKAEKAE